MDREYLRLRADQERQAAEQATDPSAKAAHLNLALAYERRLIEPEPPRRGGWWSTR